MPQRIVQTFQTRRALLRHLAPRYQQATSAQKILLLDAFIEWTGYSGKHAIKLLNHGAYEQQTIQRHRLPQYRQEVQRLCCKNTKNTKNDGVSPFCCCF